MASRTAAVYIQPAVRDRNLALQTRARSKAHKRQKTTEGGSVLTILRICKASGMDSTVPTACLRDAHALLFLSAVLRPEAVIVGPMGVERKSPKAFSYR